MTDDAPLQREPELLPCPFCDGEVQPRDALWPSDGDSDAVIHASPSVCPLLVFSNDTADKSVYVLWNRRATSGERERCIDTLRSEPTGTERAHWFRTAANYIAANKPQDIAPARDPVAARDDTWIDAHPNLRMCPDGLFFDPSNPAQLYRRATEDDARRGLNDIWPDDPYPVAPPEAEAVRRDPIALLLAEAARLQAIPRPYPLLKTPDSWNDYLENQRLARCYQDAAEFLRKSGDGRVTQPQ